MIAVFYITAVVVALATVMALTRLSAVHGLLYLVVSLLGSAVLFYLLGAPFIAALEVIIYAGAIVVLFIFVVMLLNQGAKTIRTERGWLQSGQWVWPSILAGVLAAELIFVATRNAAPLKPTAIVSPRQVGLALCGPYLIGLELASFLLLAGLLGAYHLGRRTSQRLEIRHERDSIEPRVDLGGHLVRAGAERSRGAA
jgi:NADH-quinone oxidoreductase subunit J